MNILLYNTRETLERKMDKAYVEVGLFVSSAHPSEPLTECFCRAALNPVQIKKL